MRPVFSIEEHPFQAGVVLALQGELDVAGVPALAAIVADLCDTRTAEVGLDLTRLRFIDSTGLAALLATADLCEDRGAGFWVTPASPQVERLFAMAGVREHLPLREDYLPSGRPRRLWPATPVGALQASA